MVLLPRNYGWPEEEGYRCEHRRGNQVKQTTEMATDGKVLLGL